MQIFKRLLFCQTNKHYCIPRTNVRTGDTMVSHCYAAATSTGIHRSHDNLIGSDCFHILYVDWYRWEDSWEARMARSDYLWATQGPPNSQKCTYLNIVAHIWKTGSYFVPLLYICLLCEEVLLPWNFRSPGPPNMKKKVYFCHILGLNLKADCFLIWHVYRYGWEDSWKAR